MASLAEIRRSRNLTQTAVAKALGVTQATVSYWERAGSVPQDAHAAAIMAYYDLTPQQYLEAMTTDTLNQARAIGRILRKAQADRRLSDDERERLQEANERARQHAVERGVLPADAEPVPGDRFTGWYIGPPKN